MRKKRVMAAPPSMPSTHSKTYVLVAQHFALSFDGPSALSATHGATQVAPSTAHFPSLAIWGVASDDGDESMAFVSTADVLNAQCLENGARPRQGRQRQLHDRRVDGGHLAQQVLLAIAAGGVHVAAFQLHRPSDARVRKLKVMEEITKHGQVGRASMKAGMDRKT